MGRLIDADLLKESVAKWLKSYKPDETETIKLACVLESVVEEIDEQPTAFDVDKVVEQLENYLFEKYCIEGDATVDEIVKGGGVE